MRLKVGDETGFIGIVDPDAYEGLVDPDPSRERVLDHFALQMQRAALIVWATGGGGHWPVDLELGEPLDHGLAGPLRCTSGRLLLTGYGSLVGAGTRTAEGPDVLCDVPPDDYACSVVRLPDGGFKVRLSPADPLPPPWDAPGWYEPA